MALEGRQLAQGDLLRKYLWKPKSMSVGMEKGGITGQDLTISTPKYSPTHSPTFTHNTLGC